MKKSFLSVLAAALLAISFSAQAVEVTTKLQATSNYLARGVSQANDGSVGAGIRATQGGLFAEAETNTLQDRSNLKTIVNAGYTTTIGDVALTGGYMHRLYTGTGRVTNDKNFGEVYGKAAYKGVNATVAQTVETAVGNGHNTYTRVGYTSPKFYGFTADVGTAYTHFRNEGVTRHTNTEASLSYNVLKNVKAYALYSRGGENVLGKRLANQTAFGLTAGF